MGSDESRKGSSPEVPRPVEDFVWESQSNPDTPGRVKTRLGDMADAHLEHALNCVRTWGTRAEHRVEEMLERQFRSAAMGWDSVSFFDGDFRRVRRDMGRRMREPVMTGEMLHESRKAKNWWEWERRFLLEIERRRRSAQNSPRHHAD
jgi:plasmid stabilization system protein ParE